MLENQKRCPLCRADVVAKDLVPLPPLVAEKGGGTEVAIVKPSSPKIKELIKFLRAVPKGDKSVCFSQWTSMLDIIECQFQKEGITYFRYDGKMNVGTRDRNLDAFKRYEGSCVLLVSLKCGSLGLNITEANQVFMIDPWYFHDLITGGTLRLNRRPLIECTGSGRPKL